MDQIEQLRIYLGALNICVSIDLFCPEAHTETRLALHGMGIECQIVPESKQVERIPKKTAEKLDECLRGLLATALECDADCVLTDDRSLLPYVEDFADAGVLLTSGDFLLRYVEAFVRGHDVPWSFDHIVWFETWNGFYQLAERSTFNPTITFLAMCQSKGVDPDAIELCRSLVFNRLGQLCFTRDRLWFYEMQQAVSKRSGWKRQRFAHEVAYYLNFYYLLIHGTFDHAAVFVNALFKLGIKERIVSARNSEFLSALKAKYGGVHAVFEKPDHVECMKRIAALRHISAHRGSVTPTKVVEILDPPPTNDELDQDIRDRDLEYLLLGVPDGSKRDDLREMLRTNARAARYEQQTILEDVVVIEIDGKKAFIHPLGDTWWNFNRCLSFLMDLFHECTKALP